MINQLEKNQINNALEIIDSIKPLISDAEHSFNSARGWGIVDIFGGGFLTNLIKHSKLNNAASTMNRINYLLSNLQQELKDIRFPTDYSMTTNTFATFADFMFDGILADTYMQSKIISSIHQLQELKDKLIILHDKLTRLY